MGQNFACMSSILFARIHLEAFCSFIRIVVCFRSFFFPENILGLRFFEMGGIFFIGLGWNIVYLF
jgi:hypothetical protein